MELTTKEEDGFSTSTKLYSEKSSIKFENKIFSSNVVQFKQWSTLEFEIHENFVHSRNVSLLLVSIILVHLMFIQQIGQTEIFVYEDVLFRSNDLVNKFENTQKQINILDSESQQGFNNFYAKANYIVDQLTYHAQPITL